MRISELAETTGVPVATVKLYLREGILHPGTPLTPRLSDYDESHVRRLALVRVLRDVGDVPLSRLQDLARAIEAPTTVHAMFAAAADAIAPTPPPAGPGRELFRQVADDLIVRAGWRIRTSSPDRENLAAALEAFVGHGGTPPDPSGAEVYLRCADEIGRHDIEALADTEDRQALLERMVVGQVVFGHVLSILRRLAHEHHSLERYGDDADRAAYPT